uniref:CCHC-type domain-containing protein n=1 Tax=Tanacetum cinerariifolium TaxID=118510 RepID=A0A699K2D6_TANCI|nr:hypothetical protein [Tanacetum cinerariifolium]
MSNVSTQQHYPQSSTTSPSTYVQTHLADTTQLDSGLSLMDNLIENLTNTLALVTQSYKTYLPQTNNQLRTSSNPKNQATIQDNKNRVGYANPGQARQIKCYNCNSIGYITRNCTQPKLPQNSEYFKDKMLLMQSQENGVTLDEEQLPFIAGRQDNVVDDDVDEQPIQDLALNVENVFQADDCDAFDYDVDEAPTAQNMFMANLSSAYLVYDEASPSYDSDVLSKVHNHDHYQDAVCKHHEVHEMHDDVQPNYVVESHIGYTSDSNMILYDQYKENKRLDKHGSWLYKLENLNIPHQVSKAVDEIVTDLVDWAIQAPLRARFSDLPAVDMKKILQQRMFEDKSYKAHVDHKKLYDALEESLERDYSDQLLSDLEEARQKKRMRRDVPRTPSGSPPYNHHLYLLQQPHLQQGNKALSLSKFAASASQSMAWTTSNTRYESTGLPGTQELSPTDSLIPDDSIPDKQIIPSSTVSDVENNWAKSLVLAYETPAKNSLLAKTGDMTNFLNWYCQQVNKIVLTPADLEGKAYEMVKAFYLDVIHLYKGRSPALSISKMKAASYPDFGLELLVPEQMRIDDVCIYDINAKYGISHW